MQRLRQLRLQHHLLLVRRSHRAWVPLVALFRHLQAAVVRFHLLRVVLAELQELVVHLWVVVRLVRVLVHARVVFLQALLVAVQ